MTAAILVAVSVFLAVDGFVIYYVVRSQIVAELDASLATLARSTAVASNLELVGVRQINSTAPKRYTLDGVSFGPWVGDQDPTTGAIATHQQFWDRLQLIRDDAHKYRTYGVDGGLEDAGWLLHLLGKEAIIGAWLGPEEASNQTQVDTLVRLAKAGDVDMAVVGSEVLHRGDLPVETLIAALKDARSRIPRSVPVTTADTWEQYLAHPELLAVVDAVYVNYYPYWSGVSIDSAMDTLAAWHDEVVAYAAGRPVIVSETGWPSAGDTVGSAVPSEDNASRFFLEFVTWARMNDVEYTYFSAIDEPWKAQYEGPQGAHWGYRGQDGALKPRMQLIFDGVVVEDGDPELRIDAIESRGDGNLYGQVRALGTVNHRVAVFIMVDGLWYTKPSFAAPTVGIASDGTWFADVTTGPGDDRAQRYAAFVVPKGYEPPTVSGLIDLPGRLKSEAIVWTERAR
jgi:exo-beta-1,3-glucanase (GH17 family)